MSSLKVRSTTPYWYGKLLKAALPSTGVPATPLKVPGANGIWAPLPGARSPVNGFETSWHVPHHSERPFCGRS